ncbi:hypothetical protein ACJVC5_18900 [Peredibacter sp. HCB2-198]|uniref:hypothetical protein n=1 Tax=Peredibacter sp. HCB2-198 TaxID=3383025 RepID=UPI0038B476BF
MTKSVLPLALAVGMFSAQNTSAAVPTLAKTFDTNVTTVGMTSSQEAKIQAAERKIRAVIGSEEFRTRVLNHTYNGRKQFLSPNGLTNAQIYQKILEGAEKLSPAKNNAMDITVKLYYQNSSTVGYTTTTSKVINMNTKFFNKYTSSQVAHNMMHEWMHKLGFGHTSYYTSSRIYSVPYALGKIMNELAPKY